MRRSLTITDENEKKIQQFRSLMLGGETAIDMDFTTVANLFIELGHTLWSAMKNTEGPITVQRDALAQVFLRHMQDTSLKEQGVEDLFVDWINRKLWENQLKQTTPPK
jgi:hypothetical protein